MGMAAPIAFSPSSLDIKCKTAWPCTSGGSSCSNCCSRKHNYEPAFGIHEGWRFAARLPHHRSAFHNEDAIATLQAVTFIVLVGASTLCRHSRQSRCQRKLNVRKCSTGKHLEKNLEHRGGPQAPFLESRSSGLVQVELESVEPETLADFFLGVGAVSTTVKGSSSSGSEGQVILRARPNDDTPLWDRCIVSAMFPETVDLDTVAKAVRTAFDMKESPVLKSTAIENIDWVEHVQRSWKPLNLGSGFKVLLPWHEGPEGGCHDSDGRLILRLEGGAAFGLGDHPTTQGAVEFLERQLSAKSASSNSCGPKILDYGTGSGVLALCSVNMGASVAIGVDVDAPSVQSALRSGKLTAPSAIDRTSSADGPMLWFTESPEDFSATPAFTTSLADDFGPFDVVVANILRRPLVALAPALAAAAAPGAAIALTGLRSDLGDFSAIVDAYSMFFEDLNEVPLSGGWLLIEGQRRREE
eukprot:TRINITY_DN109702_c0_g1_i1.p1 TRINITY_DN109702_c0_g1~~TRINITY_DN109702_c0_g1_i1.p1  ORF type:complete len:470 (+),score=72.52 TRINITY_DN109702_c0_g1_i1:121-1530(+)